jgi:hypothetical protein
LKRCDDGQPSTKKDQQPTFLLLPLRLHFVLLLAHLTVKDSLRYIKTVFVFVLLLVASKSFAQYKVKGHVLDSSRIYPIELVTVHSTGGQTTMTDSTGFYTIGVGEKDSIWFTYLGRPTPKYPVLKITDVTQFDIALRLKSDVMREVRIRNRNYKEDSVQNRLDYAKAFNFHRPSFGTMTSVTSSGVGFDLDEIIRLFQFRKNRSMEHFRQRLEQEERDKFIDHRFTKGLVKRLTGIVKEEELTDFMKKYRPTYEFAAGTSDYDFQFFIKIAYDEYKKQQPFAQPVKPAAP